MKTVVLELTWLDLFFIVTTLISLAGNIVQYMDRKKTFLPMKSSLIALFNDIKAKTLHAYQTQNVLFAPNNPHKDIETLRWDYASFTQMMINDLQGFQEIVVGLLVSLDHLDREGKEAFRAANYGLTPEEQELRRLSTAKYFADYDTPFQSKHTNEDEQQVNLNATAADTTNNA